MRWSRSTASRESPSPHRSAPARADGGGQVLWRRSEKPAEVESADGGVDAAGDDGVAAVADARRAEVAFAEAEHNEDRAAVRQSECRSGRDSVRRRSG